MGRKIDTTPVFKVALSTTAKRWKQPSCSLTVQGINKIWPLHAMEYYLTLTRHEILTYVATWMHPEDIMPRDKIKDTK